MTPGSHIKMVRIKFIRNVVPKPCLRKTANGGNKILKMMVSKDIIIVNKLMVVCFFNKTTWLIRLNFAF